MSEIVRPTISMIAAVDGKWNLAIDGKLPWEKQLADKKYYLAKIAGHTIIMGSTTYGAADHSRAGNRIIVISNRTREELDLPAGVELLNSVDAIRDVVPQEGEDEIFITGGGSIYTTAEVSVASRIYLNHIHTDGTKAGVETKFPELDTKNRWRVVETQHINSDEDNQFPADFIIYERV